MTGSFLDRLYIWLQQHLPARFIGRCIYRLSRSETVWLKNLLIRGFAAIYSVNTREAERRAPAEYASFNDFFTRRLRPGVRPVDERPDSFICPADGTLAGFGYAQAGTLVQAKGINYRLEELLADADLARQFRDSAYATVYLAPYNYHRLHMPLAGSVVQTIFVPGELYSVNARTTAALPNLYARNERLVCAFDGPEGPLVLVLVGAMNVASISTAWGGEYAPPADGMPVHTRFAAGAGQRLNRAAYMGHFNMGSTVVVLAPPGRLRWEETLHTGARVRVGQRLGSLT